MKLPLLLLFMLLVCFIHAFYWQAIGDPGQGWGNAILYVFMSPVVRKQLITNPLRKLIRKTGSHATAATMREKKDPTRNKIGKRNFKMNPGYGAPQG